MTDRERTDMHGPKVLSARTLTFQVFWCFPSFSPDTWKGNALMFTSFHILLLISWPFDVTCMSYCQSYLIKRNTLRAETSAQDRQWTHHVTFNAFVQLFLHWKSNKYYILCACLCTFRYPACNAHEPCCHLWPARIYNIFRHYLINGTVFEKK